MLKRHILDGGGDGEGRGEGRGDGRGDGRGEGEQGGGGDGGGVGDEGVDGGPGGGQHLSRKGTGMFRPCCLFSLLATDSHLRLHAAGV